jgi:hypothetical protein
VQLLSNAGPAPSAPESPGTRDTSAASELNSGWNCNSALTLLKTSPGAAAAAAAGSSVNRYLESASLLLNVCLVLVTRASEHQHVVTCMHGRSSETHAGYAVFL